MFILNKNTKVIQECSNADVIKICRKDTKNYTVAETKEELEGKASQEPQEEPKNTEPEGNTTEEKKEAPEGKSEGQEVEKEPESKQEEGQDGWKELPEEEKLAALESKKVEELRKIAKAEGIQGYGNMSKDTLVAMIMNH